MKKLRPNMLSLLEKVKGAKINEVSDTEQG